MFLLQETNDGCFSVHSCGALRVRMLVISVCACAGGRIQKIAWGMVDGKTVYQYTLHSGYGMTAKITNYGAILTELHVPNRNGERADVVLGFGTLDGYLAGHPYFGSTVGRVANRVASGEFSLDGQSYTLDTNNGPNHLHGGIKGFDKQVWQVTAEETTRQGATVTLKYTSLDGEEGYPGSLTVSVTFMLNASALKVNMIAETNAPTIVNLSNHSYWNLSGHNSGDVLDHVLMINADKYTPTDATLIPTGEISSVEETPFDFRRFKRIGADIGQLPSAGYEHPGGYDINFVLNGEVGTMRLLARAIEPTSGRTMEVHSNAPGVQFYTGNFLDGSVQGKDEKGYHKHAGFCLETQHFPDAINKEGMPAWPSVILRPGEVYRHNILFRFSTQ